MPCGMPAIGGSVEPDEIGRGRVDDRNSPHGAALHDSVLSFWLHIERQPWRKQTGRPWGSPLRSEARVKVGQDTCWDKELEDDNAKGPHLATRNKR